MDDLFIAIDFYRFEGPGRTVVSVYIMLSETYFFFKEFWRMYKTEIGFCLMDLLELMVTL